MNRLFGAQKPQAPPAPPAPPTEAKVVVVEEQKPEAVQEAPKVLDLRAQQEKMEAKTKALADTITGLEGELQETYKKAKTAKGASAQMYKQRCLMLMKKKKLYEQQLQQQLSNQFTLDQVQFTRENIQNTLEMGAAMKEVVAQQKQLYKDVNIDEMEDMRDEMDDMMFETQEMNEMLNRNYALDVNEADLDEEMRGLDDEYFQQVIKNHQQQQQQQQQAPAYANLVQSKMPSQQQFNKNVI